MFKEKSVYAIKTKIPFIFAKNEYLCYILIKRVARSCACVSQVLTKLLGRFALYASLPDQYMLCQCCTSCARVMSCHTLTPKKGEPTCPVLKICKHEMS